LAESDPALAPYLEATAPGEASLRLGELLQGAIAPVIRRVLARRLAGAAADLEDLTAGVLFRLQLHLEAARRGERELPLRLADYAAMSAHHAAAEHLAALRPERTRLRDRIRYVLRREPDLALWTGVGGEPLCGPIEARDRREALEDRAALAASARRCLASTGSGWGSFPALVRGVLAEAGPVRLESLVETLAALLGVHDEPLRELDGDSAARELADAAPSSVERLTSRERLRALWDEIALLPPAQRLALLTNLRGEAGAAPLETFLSSRATTTDELAAALGCASAELPGLLPELPRDDAWIAARLGLDRQQVANLRKSARLRLARRLRGTLPGAGR